MKQIDTLAPEKAAETKAIGHGVALPKASKKSDDDIDFDNLQFDSVKSGDYPTQAERDLDSLFSGCTC